jgi:hypothetical protein
MPQIVLNFMNTLIMILMDIVIVTMDGLAKTVQHTTVLVHAVVMDATDPVKINVYNWEIMLRGLVMDIVNAKATGQMVAVDGAAPVIAHVVTVLDVSDQMLTTVMHVLRTHTVTFMETALVTKAGPDVIAQSGLAPVDTVVLPALAHVMTNALNVMELLELHSHLTMKETGLAPQHVL